MFAQINVVGILLCLLAGVASTAATYLMRFSHLQAELAPQSMLTRLMYLGFAIGAYGLGFICYSIALKKLPMSLAYPIMTGFTIILVTLVGTMLLQEPLGTIKLVGIAMIMCGAFLLTM